MSSMPELNELSLLKKELARLQAENDTLRPLQYDQVTGLLVRRLFDRDAAHMVASGAGHLLTIDVDYLSLWNDLYSHSVGDTVLRNLAVVLRVNSLKHVVRWYRTGGDEVNGLLIGSQREAKAILKRARRPFERLAVVRNQLLPPSFIWGMCSVGRADHAMRELEDACPKVAVLSERDRLTARKQFLLQIADRRAYTAKIYRRALLLAQMLQTDPNTFENMGRWLFKGLGAIDRQAIVTLADTNGSERAAMARVMIREMYQNQTDALQKQSEASPGVDARDVAFRRIVLHASLQSL